jgi:outer membrane lipoprotein-sorting protein
MRFFLVLVGVLATAASPVHASGDLKATLAKLDAAAARFQTTTADFEFQSVQTEPVPDTSVQKGVVYYKREGETFQMGVHINNVDGQPVPKIITCCEGGKVQLFDVKPNQLTVLNKLNQYESLFMLGFGASGKELAAKFDITDDGQETIDGVTTEKLEMIPKDPNLKRNLAKVTLWMDLARGISLKQLFNEDPSHYRVCTYVNIRMNQSLPRDAFTIKTNKQTSVVNR